MDEGWEYPWDTTSHTQTAPERTCAVDHRFGTGEITRDTKVGQPQVFDLSTANVAFELLVQSSTCTQGDKRDRIVKD